MPTKVITSLGEDAIRHATNVIKSFIFNILAKGLNIYFDLKIVASADKENIIRQKIADKKYYICGRGCKPLRPKQ